jgi:hypothetical protein
LVANTDKPSRVTGPKFLQLRCKQAELEEHLHAAPATGKKKEKEKGKHRA